MSFSDKLAYKLHPAVFFRNYEKVVVVYHTAQQKIYTFNDSAGSILGFFTNYTDISSVIDGLNREYDQSLPNDSLEEIKYFISELVEKSIIVPKYQQRGVIEDLEKEISYGFSEGEQLYSVTFELTYNCNERCRHCYVSTKNKDEIGYDRIITLLDELAEMRVLNIVFTGGEIFSRTDAFDILEYAYSNRFLIDIFTNGTLLDGNDYIRLKRIWPRCVNFSLYSHIPEKHDSVTRIPGSYEKTLNSIRSCVDIGIPVNIKSPIFSETKDDIEGLIELANSIGCSVELGTNITPKTNGDISPLAMRIDYEHDKKGVDQNSWRCIEKNHIGNTVTINNDKICGAGDRSLCINPYGEVYPCNMLHICIGDVIKDSIKDIWNNSEKLQSWRRDNKRSLRKGCEGCEYGNECVFCPGEALMRNGNPLAMYEDACKLTKTYLERRRYAEEGRKKDISETRHN